MQKIQFFCIRSLEVNLQMENLLINRQITAGDEVYFVPLLPASKELLGGSMYMDKQDLFIPLCLPIKGTYDDYGSQNENLFY